MVNKIAKWFKDTFINSGSVSSDPAIANKTCPNLFDLEGYKAHQEIQKKKMTTLQRTRLEDKSKKANFRAQLAEQAEIELKKIDKSLEESCKKAVKKRAKHREHVKRAETVHQRNRSSYVTDTSNTNVAGNPLYWTDCCDDTPHHSTSYSSSSSSSSYSSRGSDDSSYSSSYSSSDSSSSSSSSSSGGDW